MSISQTCCECGRHRVGRAKESGDCLNCKSYMCPACWCTWTDRVTDDDCSTRKEADLIRTWRCSECAEAEIFL